MEIAFQGWKPVSKIGKRLSNWETGLRRWEAISKSGTRLAGAWIAIRDATATALQTCRRQPRAPDGPTKRKQHNAKQPLAMQNNQMFVRFRLGGDMLVLR